MRSPLRMPPPSSNRFFRMKRENNQETEEEEEEEDPDTVTLSAYIANQMQGEKVRTIREANLQGQTGHSCDKNRRRTCQVSFQLMHLHILTTCTTLPGSTAALWHQQRRLLRVAAKLADQANLEGVLSLFKLHPRHDHYTSRH